MCDLYLVQTLTHPPSIGKCSSDPFERERLVPGLEAAGSSSFMEAFALFRGCVTNYQR